MTELNPGLLLTDLYQLSMLKSYRAEAMNDIAVFEFFVRRLPSQRNYLIAAGLAQLLDYLDAFRFADDELVWLATTGRYDREFIDYLAALRFTGDVDAMPEGTPVFSDQPLVRITAPLPQAQLIESRLVNILHYQTLVASKAERCVSVAQGKTLVDFGMRRAHGAEAALFAARASYLGGFDGTATVLAERLYGVPAFGTMAHSYIQAHASECDAFERFAQAQPNTTLLVDTYDTLRGVDRVIGLLPALRKRGVNVGALRLDSGDLIELSRAVRAQLDRANETAMRIFCSGSLDEYAIEKLLASGAPIDGFGVGTALAVSADAPALDCAYKLQEYAGQARRKRSTGKSTWPGRKQVYRHYRADETMAFDVIALVGEAEQGGTPLLRPVMRGGQRVAPQPDLLTARAYCAQQVASLPDYLRSLQRSDAYPVQISPAIRAMADAVDQQFT